jgi:hypothetical protein
MEQQALKDIPKTPQEYRRQKGPVPMIAIFLVIALFAVLFFFWGLPIIENLVPDEYGE